MDVRKRILALGLALVVGALTVACGGGGASGSGEEGGELTLGTIGWTENVAISNLTKVVMEDELGYEVQIQGPLDLGPLFQGVAGGDLAAFQDVWLPNNRNYLDKPQIKENVEVLEPWYEGETSYGIAVPAYMENVRAIPDLKGVVDRIVGIEPGASFHPQIRNKVIPGYNLDDIKLVESSTAGMLAELQRAYEDEEPIAFLRWSPHWMNEEYDLRYLEDPKDLQGEFNDPSRITTVVNADLKEDDPVAYAFLNAITLDEEQLNKLELEIKEAGDDNPEEGVRNWLQDNPDVAEPWVQAAQEAQGS
ncbi:MAG: glycine betaine ABC transporter substrate-binding protein [Actinomycetota bacterium]